MNDWTPWVRVGVQGAAQTPLPALDTALPLGQLLQQLPPGPPAHHYLQQLAAMSAYQLAGRMPARRLAVTPPAIVDPRPLCCPALTHHLRAILDHRFAGVLPELLGALHTAGRRVPPIFLPQLLDRGRRLDLRPQVLRIIGEHGRWLAAQNPAWHYATLDPADWSDLVDRWQAAPLNQRVPLLRQLRATAPDAARQLIENRWEAIEPTQRQQLLRALEVGLGPTDEPFLEKVLDDRAQGVRVRAAELLGHLPQSRYAQRMIEYAVYFLTWSGGAEDPIKITFPRTPTAAMIRDGLPHRPGDHIARFRTKQLAHLVAALPLAYWQARWSATPATVCAAALAGRWPRTLITNLARAARQQGDADWAEALLLADEASSRTAKLITLLPPEALTRVITHFRHQPGDAPPLARNSPLQAILRQGSLTWTPAIAREWLADFAMRIAADGAATTPDALLRSALTRLALTCPPSLADEAATLLAPTAEGTIWHKPIERFLATLRFRQAMHADLAAQAHLEGEE